MVRVKNGVQTHKTHKKILKQAKGFRLGRSKVYTQAKDALVKQGQHAYRSRRLKKRDFRSLRIERLSAALSSRDLNYSRFIAACNNADIKLNRKVLSNVAVAFPTVFDKIVDTVQK